MEKVIRGILRQYECVYLQKNVGRTAGALCRLTLEIVSRREIKSLFSRSEESSAKLKFRFDGDKRKYVVVERRNNVRICPSSSIGQYKFDRVKQFECLGTILTGNDKTVKEIETRIRTGIGYFFGLARLLEFRFLSRDQNRLYIFLIRPIVTFEVKSRPIRKTDESTLWFLKRTQISCEN